MKLRLLPFLLLTVLIVAAVPAPAAASHRLLTGGGCTPTVHQHGCTVFMAADDQVALGGNNEDWRNPLTKLWFVPAGKTTFGLMYVGFDNFYPQGGMNDQGLFFDGLAVEPTIVPPKSDLPQYPGPGSLIDGAMTSCVTVQCVIDFFSRYDRSGLVGAQLFFGDASGDAVIIEPVEFIRKQGKFLVSTNFYQSATPPGQETCNRYKTAQAILGQADAFSVDLFRDVLEATHQDGDYPTQYSNVYDLKAKVMYLYYFQDFEHVRQFDLAQELAQGAHAYDMVDLFPENTIAASWRGIRQQDFEARLKRSGYQPDTDTSRFASYAGRYAVPQAAIDSGATSAAYIELSVVDSQLFYDLPGDTVPPMPLYPTSETTFLSTSYDMAGNLFTAEMQFDSSGQVSAVQGDFGGTPVVFERIP